MTSAPEPESVLSTLESANRLLVQQVFKPIGNEYRISVPAAASTDETTPILYVKQKKLSIREDIRFRLSPDEKDHLFMIKSKSLFEFRGRHEVLDSAGSASGCSRRTSRARSSAATGVSAMSPGRSSSRRTSRVGRSQSSVEWPASSPSGWHRWGGSRSTSSSAARAARLGRIAGCSASFRDRYVLEVTPELADVDRRLLVAFAVGLDALQDRVGLRPCSCGLRPCPRWRESGEAGGTTPRFRNGRCGRAPRGWEGRSTRAFS